MKKNILLLSLVLLAFLNVVYFVSNISALDVDNNLNTKSYYEPEFNCNIWTYYNKYKTYKNAKLTGWHPQLSDKWRRANGYYFSNSSINVSVSVGATYGYGDVSVAVSKSANSGWFISANSKKYSKVKFTNTGTLTKWKHQYCPVKNKFNVTKEYYYPVYK
ncbi:MAG: hypothetical protein LBR40_04370 [Bacilli bacterium]|jgi:hypothetical protein|nr:hypothetical protein [Bacilli bacterium]